MAARDRAFEERCLPLACQLGGDPIARQAAHAIVRELGIDSLEALRAHREKVGEKIFDYEIRDMRHVGAKIATRIANHVGPQEPVT